MSEKRLLLDGIEINYNGIFDIKQLLRKIDELTAEKGYSKQEKRREELVKPTGKEFFIELRPTKIKTAYFALMIKITMRIKEITDIEITRDKIRMNAQKGKINIIIDAWTTTDYEKRWEKKPLFYFLRNMLERVTWKTHTDAFLGELDDDTRHIYNNLKAYLELHKFE